jgi:hypothetical protein
MLGKAGSHEFPLVFGPMSSGYHPWVYHAQIRRGPEEQALAYTKDLESNVVL